MVEYLWHAFPDGRDIRAASWFIQVFDDEHKEMANEMCADGASFEEAVVSYTHPDSLWPGTPFFVVRPNTPELSLIHI